MSGYVLTMGTFDLPHPGHVALLRECRKLAGVDGRVVVGLNLDSFVARFKERAPVMSYAERAEVLSACRYVDEIVENDGRDQPAMIEKVGPDWLAIGVDWARRDYYGQLEISPQWLAERNISLVYLAHLRSDAISTTKLRGRMT